MTHTFIVTIDTDESAQFIADEICADLEYEGLGTPQVQLLVSDMSGLEGGQA